MKADEEGDDVPGEAPAESFDVTEASSSRIRDVSIQQSIHQVQLFIPSVLEVLSDVADRHPDMANKVVDDIIRKGEHRQQVEMLVIQGDDRRSSRAQVLSWVFAMTALVGAIVLLALDRSTVGLSLIAIAVAPLVGVNLIGRLYAQRERQDKAALARRLDGVNSVESAD